MNELLVWWYLWVNSNCDVLIMTITLLVVGGLVLEVVRLNKRIEKLEERLDWSVEGLCGKFDHMEDFWTNNITDQVKVNTRLAEDIAKLQKRLKEVKTKRKSIRK